MSRIGVFLCYCGSNIAATVDVEAVAEMARSLPDVVYVETNKYTCSDPGQEGVKNAIIMDGRVPHSILMEILTDEGAGTMVKGE